MTFQQQLADGRAGESEIARWLIERGSIVVPVYEKIIDEGKGPQVFTAKGQFIAPDLLAIRHGKLTWIEAKHKTAFPWNRNRQVFVTGIDLHHYQQYIKVQCLSEVSVWLLFLHKGGQAKDSPPSPAGLFGNSLRILALNENHRCSPDKYGKGGMVYWTRDCDGGALLELSKEKRDTEYKCGETMESSWLFVI